jgi:hypothetical protein
MYVLYLAGDVIISSDLSSRIPHRLHAVYALYVCRTCTALHRRQSHRRINQRIGALADCPSIRAAEQRAD